MLLVHATLTHGAPETVMTLTFLFVMMCVGNVYLRGADRTLLIGSLLPHTNNPPSQTRCRLVHVCVWGGSLLRRPCPHQQTQQSQHNTPVSHISRAL